MGAKMLNMALALGLLLLLPELAAADPGHAIDAPHLDQQQTSNDGGGGGSTLLVVATLATLVIFAICAIVLKQAQSKRQ